jgi:hypothetical protein
MLSVLRTPTPLKVFPFPKIVHGIFWTGMGEVAGTVLERVFQEKPSFPPVGLLTISWRPFDKLEELVSLIALRIALAIWS